MPRIDAGIQNVDDSGKTQRVTSLCDPRYSASLERGLAILGCFTPERPIRGIREIAAELGIGRSTTHRYMSTLAQLGYLKRGPNRRYRLSLRVSSLGMSASSSTSLGEHARPYMQELCERSGYTVSLAVLDGAEVLYLECIRGKQHRALGDAEIILDLQTGSWQPAHCTAEGKLLLAWLPKDVREKLLLEMQLTRQTPATITSRRKLRDALEGICEEASLAANNQELAQDLYAIAAPVRSETGEVIAAVSIAAPASAISLDELMAHLGPHLVTTADWISARLGYRRADETTA